MLVSIQNNVVRVILLLRKLLSYYMQLNCSKCQVITQEVTGQVKDIPTSIQQLD